MTTLLEQAKASKKIDVDVFKGHFAKHAPASTMLSLSDDMIRVVVASMLDGGNLPEMSSQDWHDILATYHADHSAIVDINNHGLPVDAEGNIQGDTVQESIAVDLDTATGIERFADEIASKMSTATQAMLVADYDRQLESKVFTIEFLAALIKDIGKDKVRSMPRPGSTVKTRVGNEGIDRYTVTVKTVVDGKEKSKQEPRSFYSLLIRKSSIGIELRKEIVHLREALKKPENRDPALYRDSDKKKARHELAAELDTATARERYYANKARESVKIQRQMDAVNELPKCGARMAVDSTGKVLRRNSPVIIFDENPSQEVDDKGVVTIRPNESGHTPVSIPTFLRFKVADAAKAGGSRADLEATIMRNRDDVGQTKGDKKAQPDIDDGNVKLFVDWMAAGAHFLEKKNNMLAAIAMLKANDTDEHVYLSLDNLRGSLDGIAGSVQAKIDVAQEHEARRLVAEAKVAAA